MHSMGMPYSSRTWTGCCSCASKCRQILPRCGLWTSNRVEFVSSSCGRRVLICRCAWAKIGKLWGAILWWPVLQKLFCFNGNCKPSCAKTVSHLDALLTQAFALHTNALFAYQELKNARSHVSGCAAVRVASFHTNLWGLCRWPAALVTWLCLSSLQNWGFRSP